MAGIDYKELQESFISSSLSILQKSESCILILESKVDQNAIDELFRGIHTIKGNSGIFELHKIPYLSHSFEDVLNQLRLSRITPTPDLIDLMLLGLDRLREMISNLDVSELVEVEDLVIKFKSYLTPKKNNATQEAEIVFSPKEVDESFKWMQHIKVSNRVMEFAKAKNKFLSIVIINLKAQEFNTISEFLDRVQLLSKKLRVLRKGLVEKKINSLNNNAKLYLPYFLILLSDSKVESFLLEVGITSEFLTTVFVPENVESVQVNQEKEEPANRKQPVKEPSIKDTNLNVNIELLNNLINLTGEIVLSRNILSLKIQQSGNSELVSISKRFEHLLSELESGIMKTRLQSMNVFFQKIPRLVRDISKATGKEIKIHLEGGDVELDKSLIDELSDPVTHLIRNAVDHGIEEAYERTKKGKEVSGNILVSARLRGGNVELVIGDDGKGLDIERIRSKIIQKELAGEDHVRRMSKEELVEYLFMPGFSTAGAVTELSGRGVGLDVVRSNVKKIGGTVSIDSEEGVGTSFILSIPQTLSIVKCLIIKSGNRKFAIPQQYLSELIKVIPTKLKQIENRSLYELRNHLLPLINLTNLFKLGIQKNGEKFVIALRSEKYYFGVVADEVLDTEEIVVKPLGEYFEELGFFAGATVLGDGDIALILDVSGLARLSGMQNSLKLIEAKNSIEAKNEKENYLLFSVGKTKLTMSILSNPYIVKVTKSKLIQYLGLDIFIHNKESVPILWLNEALRLDIDMKEFDSFNIILFKASSGLIGVAATNIEGVITDLENISLEKIKGEGILGTAFKDGQNIILLDVSFLSDNFYENKLKNIKLNL